MKKFFTLPRIIIICIILIVVLFFTVPIPLTSVIDFADDTQLSLIHDNDTIEPNDEQRDKIIELLEGCKLRHAIFPRSKTGSFGPWYFLMFSDPAVTINIENGRGRVNPVDKLLAYALVDSEEVAAQIDEIIG